MRHTLNLPCTLIACSAAFLSAATSGAPKAVAVPHPGSDGIPSDAGYACPMETHPDEAEPARQGAYFSAAPGDCPWCGMKLKPLEELPWVHARRAAQGAAVAYTCTDHQHVFSNSAGECPRCGKALEPFKVMHTCPDPQHADYISAEAGTCPRCSRSLVPFRGVWLSPDMADKNTPPHPEVAEAAAYHCPVHPLVHCDRPARCPVCAAELVAAGGLAGAAEPSRAASSDRSGRPPSRPSVPATAPGASPIPADAKFVCPMKECWQFAAEPGSCPTCGMNLRPINEVAWARQMLAAQGASAPAPRFVCPMHPDQVAVEHGTCPVCGMQLVEAEAVPQPATVPAAIAVQMNYLMEHYLELQRRFSSDTTKEVALHALGLVGAADEMLKLLNDPGAGLPPEFADAARRLRTAALKTTGENLDADRITFVELGGAMRTLVDHVRPDVRQYPKLFVFHCPMTKGDWIQTSRDMANPFYGFRMLKCGQPIAEK